MQFGYRELQGKAGLPLQTPTLLAQKGIDFFGVEQVVFGSDYPFDNNDGLTYRSRRRSPGSAGGWWSAPG